MKIYVKNTLNGLMPLFQQDDEEKKEYLKLDEVYEVEIKKPRNPVRHRAFFALLNIAYQNTDTTVDREVFREWVLIQSGHVVMYKMPDGEFMQRAKSISFAKCDELEFRDVFNKVFDFIMIWLQVSEDELIGAMDSALGDKLRGFVKHLRK